MSQETKINSKFNRSIDAIAPKFSVVGGYSNIGDPNSMEGIRSTYILAIRSIYANEAELTRRKEQIPPLLVDICERDLTDRVEVKLFPNQEAVIAHMDTLTPLIYIGV